MQHTFSYNSLPLFCTSKTGNFFSLPNYMFYGGNVRVPVQFVFSLPLIFTLLAASTSNFLTVAISFSCFSSNEICLRCYLFHVLALSLLSKLMLTLKFSEKKDSFLAFFIFSLKVRAAICLQPKRAGCFRSKISPHIPPQTD